MNEKVIFQGFAINSNSFSFISHMHRFHGNLRNKSSVTHNDDYILKLTNMT